MTSSLPDNTLWRDKLLKAFGVQSDEQYVDDRAKFLIEDILPVIQDAVNEATVRPVADLAECLGVLRGLGHPNETLEAKYDLTKGETDANR